MSTIYKLDIYQIIDGSDDWPKIDTVYGNTEQTCLDYALRKYGQEEFHWTNPTIDTWMEIHEKYMMDGEQ